MHACGFQCDVLLTASEAFIVPLSLHVRGGAVSVQHGVVAGFMDAQTVELDGLSPLQARERIVSLQLDPLQMRRKIAGAAGDANIDHSSH